MTYRLTQEEAVGILYSWLYEYGLPGVNMNASGNSPAEIVDRWHREELRKAKAEGFDEGVVASGLDLDYILQLQDQNPYRSKA